MGSLTSTPKIAAPAVSQASNTPQVSEETTQDEKETHEIEAQERKKSLLARDRSRAGTIGTTLQGVLVSIGEDEGRKTLLGQ